MMRPWDFPFTPVQHTSVDPGEPVAAMPIRNVRPLDGIPLDWWSAYCRAIARAQREWRKT